jgi:hypothetical protein
MTAIAPFQTEFVLEARVSCSAPLNTGASSRGARKLIPITGGTFEGPRLKGTVLAGGGDWQLLRPDGVLEIDAHYTIQADDGACISVRNRGIVVMSPAPYVRTVPEFEAPIGGPHEWLNKNVFVGTLNVVTRDPLVVQILVFRVL